MTLHIMQRFIRSHANAAAVMYLNECVYDDKSEVVTAENLTNVVTSFVKCHLMFECCELYVARGKVFCMLVLLILD